MNLKRMIPVIPSSADVRNSPSSIVKESLRKRIPNQKAGRSKERTKKSVSFCQNVLARRHLHIKDFSEQEFGQCWYGEKEFKVFKYEAWVTASLIEEDLLKEDTTNLCQRGVEMFLPSAKIRNAEINAIRDLVFHEQEWQWEEGMWEPEAIADMYKIVSAKSLSEARKVGLEDERKAT